LAIARRRAATFDAIAPPMPAAPVPPPPAPVGGAPVSLGDAPAAEVVTPVGRLRRCTFRRVDQVAALSGRPAVANYEITCLYGDSETLMALGDVDAAGQVCEVCTASGIFRPDED